MFCNFNTINLKDVESAKEEFQKVIDDLVDLEDRTAIIKKALSEVVENYEFSGWEPNLEQAYRYYKGYYNDAEYDGSEEKRNAKMSFDVISGYEKAIWLVRVAFDYCHELHKDLSKLSGIDIVVEEN